MANDKKSRVTEIEDWDDDLDNLFGGDEFDFELDERKVKSDDRKPVDRVVKGTISGMKSHLASREAQLKFVKSALPKEYSYPIESVSSATESIARLYDDSARELRPKLSAVIRAASKVMPREYSFTKKLAEKFERWGGSEPKRYQGMSEQDIQDNEVASMLTSVFGEQVEQQEKERAENRIQKRITDKRMRGMQGMLGSLVNYASEHASYQKSVDIAYKKKSLELQLRSFATQETLLRESRQHFEATRVQNEAIIKNTGYPDFIKLRKSEDFAQSMQRRLYDNIQSGLFGKGDFLKKGVENLKTGALRKVGDFGAAMDMAKEGLEGVQEYRDAMKQNAELMGEEYDGLKEGSSTAGKTALGWIGGQIGKRIRSKLDREDGKSKRYGYAASRYIQDLPGLLDRLEESQLVSEADYTGGIKGFAGKAVGSLINTFRPKGLELGLEKEGGLKFLNQPAIFDNRFKKTVESVIPGYLARILRTVQIIQSGNQDIKLTLFDHENSDFTDASSLSGRISSRLKKTATSSGWHNSEMESTLNLLDPDKKLNDDERKALQSVLVKAMFSGRGMGPEALTRRENLRHLDPKISKKLSAHFDETFISIEDREKKGLKISQKLRNLKSQVGDIRGEIQSLYDAGYSDVLMEAGIIKEENGYLQIDVAKYMEFLGTEIGESIHEDLVLDESPNQKKRKRNRLTAKQEAQLLLRQGKKKAKAKIKDKIDQTKSSDLIQSASKRIEESGVEEYIQHQMDSVKSLISEENQKQLIDTKNEIISTLRDKEKRDELKEKALAQKDQLLEQSKELMTKIKDKEERDVYIANIESKLTPHITNLHDSLSQVKETLIDPEKRKGLIEETKKDAETHLENAKTLFTDKEARSTFVQRQKDQAKKAIKDIYIKGQSSPAIKATELQAKKYFDQATGKVVASLKDIKGPIIDVEGNIVISIEDLQKGVEDNQGKSLKIKLHPKIANIVKNRQGLLEAGKAKVESLQNTASDFYNNAAASLTSPSQEGGEKASPLAGSSGNLVGSLASGFKGLRERLQSDTAKDLLQKGKDLWKDKTSKWKSPESGEPQFKLSGFLTQGKGGKLLEAGKSRLGRLGNWASQGKAIFDQYKSEQEAKKTSTTPEGEKASSTDNVQGDSSQPIGLLDRAKSFGRDAVRRKDQAISSLRAKLDQNELSSERKGGWRGIMEAYRLRDEENKRNQQQIQAPTDPRYLGGKGVLDGLVGKLKSTMGNILDGFGSISDLLAGRNKKGGLIGKTLKYFAKGYSKMPGDALRMGKGALNIGSKALTAAKHLSGYSTVKSLYNVGGKALPHLANVGRVAASPFARIGAPLAEGVGALKTTATGARLVQAANIARVGLLAGGEVFGGSLGGAAMTGLGMSLSAIGAALTSPVVLGAAAVAAVGYGGYKAYKYFTRNKASDITKIRLRQYGLTNELESNYHRIFALEDYLLDGRIGFKGFDPQMASGKIDVAELLDIFDIDPKDGKMLQRFMTWWNNRFKLVFFHHLKALKQINDKASLKEIDDLNEDEKRRYINAASMEYGPFDEVSSPFKEFDTLLANKNDVEREILNAKNKLEGLKKKDNRPAFLLKRDQEKKDNEAKSTARNNEPSLYDKAVDWTSNKLIDPLMGGLKSAGGAIKSGYNKAVDWTSDKIEQGVEGVKKGAGKVVDWTNQNVIEPGSEIIKKGSRVVHEAIEAAAKKYGLNPDMMKRIAMIESSMNPSVINRLGYKGLFQFGAAAAKDYGISGKELDPFTNADAAARMMVRNAKYLIKKRIPVNATTLYLAHQQGPGGAFNIWNAFKNGGSVSGSIRNAMNAQGIGAKSPKDFLLHWAKKLSDSEGIKAISGESFVTPSPVKNMGELITDKSKEKGEMNLPHQEAAPKSDTLKVKNPSLINESPPKETLASKTEPSIEKTQIPNASIKKSDLPPPNPNLPGEESGKDQTPKRLTKSDAFKVSGANMAGVNPEFLSRFDAAAQEFVQMGGKNPTVTSGFRDPEKQKQLYAQAKDKSYVAKPGNSMHEYGYALDVDYKSGDSLNQMDKMGLLQKHGLWRPLLSKSPFEPWHLEPAPPFNRAVVRHTKGAVGGLSGGGAARDVSVDQETQKPTVAGLGVEPYQPTLKSDMGVEGASSPSPQPPPQTQAPKPIEIPGLQKPPIDQYVPPTNDFSNLEGGIGKTNEILQKSHDVLAQLLSEIQQHTPLLRELSSKFIKNESNKSDASPSQEASPEDWQRGIKDAQLKRPEKGPSLKPAVDFSRRAI